MIFRSREILTGPGALIPRPETAELAEWAGAWIRRKAGGAPKGMRILDLCCGTGCIGISLQTDFPEAEVTLTDLSGEALAIARIDTQATTAARDAMPVLEHRRPGLYQL